MKNLDSDTKKNFRKFQIFYIKNHLDHFPEIQIRQKC